MYIFLRFVCFIRQKPTDSMTTTIGLELLLYKLCDCVSLEVARNRQK